MLNTLLLAQSDMTAMMASPSFKTYATYLLVGVALLALFWPAALAKLKAGFAGMIENAVKDRIPKDTDAANPAVGPSEPLQPVTELVKRQAIALKTACPNATPDLRLKWLEQGYDAPRAQADYIAVLEGKLATTPATPLPVDLAMPT
jgi:hypothetical protein